MSEPRRRPPSRASGRAGHTAESEAYEQGMPQESPPSFSRHVCPLGAVPAGTYRSTQGGGPVTLDVRRPRHGEGKGTTFVYARSRISGEWNLAGSLAPKGRRYLGSYTEAVRNLLADPMGCARAYGAHSGHCSGCGADLMRGSICEPCARRIRNVLTNVSSARRPAPPAG